MDQKRKLLVDIKFYLSSWGMGVGGGVELGVDIEGRKDILNPFNVQYSERNEL